MSQHDNPERVKLSQHPRFITLVGVLITIIWAAYLVRISRLKGGPGPMPGLAFAMAFVGVASGIGIMMRWNWARRITLLGAGIYVVAMATELGRPGRRGHWPPLYNATVEMVWNILLLWYFLHPSVKAQFQKPEEPVVKKRSAGVTIFGVLFICLGIYDLLLPFQTALYYYLQGAQSAAVRLAVIGSGKLISGIGILLLMGWGRHLILAVALFSIFWLVKDLVGLRWGVTQFSSIVAMQIIAIGWDGLILWYFLRPSVKAQFARNAPTR